jgi:cobalt-zinc-cadmium efflux system outer membrane protein
MKGKHITPSILFLSSILLVITVAAVHATEVPPPSLSAVSEAAVQHAPVPDATVLPLASAVSIALKDNSSLAELVAKAEALGAVPPQAGALPDPTLGLNALNLPTDTFALDQEPMTQIQITITQAVPFPGKLGLKRQAATHEAGAAATRVQERQLELMAEVRGTWWQLFALDRALEIVDQNQQLMREFIEVAQTQYKVGKGLQQDVLLAQLELSRLLDRELKLQGQREATQAGLNALLNRSADSPVQLPVKPPSEALPVLPAESELLRQAETDRPLLAVQRQRIEAAGAQLDLAKKDFYPDFKLGAGYGFRQGTDPLRGVERPDFFTVMFSINVPIYFQTKQRKAVEQRTSELFARRFTLEDTLRSVQAAIARRLADYQASREQVLLLRTGIIPQAEQTVSAMLAAYQVGEVDFLNVVNVEITLYNAEIDYWQVLSEAKLALAHLAAAVGAEALYE